MENNNNILANLKNDLPASIIVFLVAVPLCLGIALASGAPLFSGIIAGIIGGSDGHGFRHRDGVTAAKD